MKLKMRSNSFLIEWIFFFFLFKMFIVETFSLSFQRWINLEIIDLVSVRENWNCHSFSKSFNDFFSFEMKNKRNIWSLDPFFISVENVQLIAENDVNNDLNEKENVETKSNQRLKIFLQEIFVLFCQEKNSFQFSFSKKNFKRVENRDINEKKKLFFSSERTRVDLIFEEKKKNHK